MDIERIREFIAVVDKSSFSAAARSLNLTQPVISRHVRSLEEELGVELIDRSSGGAKCTLAGKVFLGHALRIASACDEAVSDLARLRATPTYHLHIETFVEYKPTDDLIEALEPELLSRNHFVEMTTADITTTDPLDDVASGACDIALVGHGQGLAREGLAFEPIITEPLVALVGSSHVLADRQVISPADLADITVWISDISFKYQHRCIRDLLEQRGVRPHYAVRNWASAADQYTRVSRVDDGVSIVYASEARHSISTIRGGLRVLHFDDPLFRSTVSAVYDPKASNPAVAWAIEAMRDVVAQADMSLYWR